MSASKGSAKDERFKIQNSLGGIYSRYAKIDRVSKDQVAAKNKESRLGALQRLEVKSGVLTLKDGSQHKIRRIKPDGMILLENWDVVDPLLL